MTRINLLPWREKIRQEKKKEFLSVLLLVSFLSLFASYLWIDRIKDAISNQNSRNQLLQSEIAQLQEQVREIVELKKQRQDLCDRLEVIQNLQGTRPFIVHYFDEMVRVVPGNLFLTEIERKGDLFGLKGITESNNRVSELMRSLDKSDWYRNPNLKTVIADPDFGEQASRFEMSVNTDSPNRDDESLGSNSCFKGKGARRARK
jgi:type IV pilus assembly protein PilN